MLMVEWCWLAALFHTHAQGVIVMLDITELTNSTTSKKKKKKTNSILK